MGKEGRWEAQSLLPQDFVLQGERWILGDYGFFSHFSYSTAVSWIKSQTSKPGLVIPGFIGVDGLNGASLFSAGDPEVTGACEWLEMLR